MPQSLRIAIAACEPSGDMLGGELMLAIQARTDGAAFTGIAGPRMRAAGCQTLIESEQLSVMGIFEVLFQLPRLLGLRRQIIRQLLDHPPDLFIGIDSPDFNFAVEQRLKKAGIPVVHYISPSVWAWREYRVRRIARCVDLMLTLLPFEKAFYQRHHIAVEYVGHPLADLMPEQPDRNSARSKLDIADNQSCVVLLPGSRMSEVRRLLPVFLKTAQRLAQKYQPLCFLMVAATAEIYAYMRQNIPSQLNICLLEGDAQSAMSAANAALVASGTATLECLLAKCPMVVAYIMHPASFFVARRLLTVPYVSLPNHLAGRQIVPEYLQRAATPESLCQALTELLDNPDLQHVQTECFYEIHKQLRHSANERAAAIILNQWSQYAENCQPE